ncbi:MAG TPA: efflux RND transporter periplasmic adaptor subunit [Terriglobales bacterium]|nr:efflux RND transporter periplasmic adaptor subunit [Terriglobales bacterium]
MSRQWRNLEVETFAGPNLDLEGDQAARHTRGLRWLSFVVVLALSLGVLSCSRETKAAANRAEIPVDPNVFETDRPDLFKTARVTARPMPTTLTANGTIAPDISRTIRVTSLGGGRVVDLKVKLGDSVKKGQTLLVISSPDLSLAFADYQKALADERVAQKALDRARLLFDRGAVAEKDLQVAQGAEDKAKIDVETAEQRVRVLGGNPARPSPRLELRAPIAGAIVEQNVAGFEGVKSIDNSPNLLTIADLSQVWVVCDVFENELGDVQVGDTAEIRLNAFPDRTFKGALADISRVLDPSTRTAKVRIVLGNGNGLLRPGMFAVATFHSRKLQPRLMVTSTSVMRLHDKDWVFRKEGADRFRRVEVRTAGGSPDGMLEIRDGVRADDEVAANALDFSTAVAEKKE